jgi:molecular chaperone DnaK (HSP70)
MSFDLRIVNHLVDVFQTTLKKKAPGSPDLRTLPRVMARLLMTANRAKEVLSANKEASVYVRICFLSCVIAETLIDDSFVDVSGFFRPRVCTPTLIWSQ